MYPATRPPTSKLLKKQAVKLSEPAGTAWDVANPPHYVDTCQVPDFIENGVGRVLSFKASPLCAAQQALEVHLVGGVHLAVGVLLVEELHRHLISLAICTTPRRPVLHVLDSDVHDCHRHGSILVGVLAQVLRDAGVVPHVVQPDVRKPSYGSDVPGAHRRPWPILSGTDDPRLCIVAH